MRFDLTRLIDALWRPLAHYSQQNFSKAWFEWLSAADSMTQRLCTHSKTFEVNLLRQEWDYPFPSERRILNIAPRQLVVVREVELICDAKPWMFARTIVPEQTLSGANKKLHSIGTTPIGHILFSDPHMQREPFEIAQIKEGSYYYSRSYPEQKPSLWGRRSIFHLKYKPLLVTEIFTGYFPLMTTTGFAKNNRSNH